MRRTNDAFCPPRRVAAVLGLGALIGSGAGLTFGRAAILPVAAGMLLLGFLLFACRRAAAALCLLTVIPFLALGIVHRDSLAVPIPEEAVPIRGDVIDVALSGTYCTVRVTDGGLPAGTRMLLYCNSRAMPEPGDTVETTALVSGLGTAQWYLRADEIVLTAQPLGYGEDAVTVLSSAENADFFVQVRRQMIAAVSKVLPKEEGALLSAVCLGYKGRISPEITAAFRTCGLPHLLVVSGLHLAVVAGGVWLLLRACRVRRRLAVLLTMAATVLFMLLVGLSPSVVRAGVMYLILLSGRLFRRRADGLNSVGMALIPLLIADPCCIYDVGMWLSFGATVGVLALAPRLQRLWCGEATPRASLPMRLWRTVASALAVTVGAVLPILPLTAVLFGSVSTLSPLANLLAVLPAGWMLTAGWIGLVLSFVPGLRVIGNIAFRVAGILARGLINLTAALSSLPMAAIPTREAWLLLWIGVAAVSVSLALIYHRPRRLRRVCAGLAAILLLAGGIRGISLRDGVTVTFLPTDGSTVILENARAHTVLVQDAADLTAVLKALDEHDVRPVDLVVIDSGEVTDTATVAAFFRRYPEAKLLTDDADWMYSTSFSSRRIAETALPVLGGRADFAVTERGLWDVTIDGSHLRILLPKSEVAPVDFSAAMVYNNRWIRLGHVQAEIVAGQNRFFTRGDGEWSIRR